jgi:vacuolar-type H+-ATPase subunit H
VRWKDRPLERSALEKSISERLTEIVAAAEQAAGKVIDDAESEARRHLSEAEAEA